VSYQLDADPAVLYNKAKALDRAGEYGQAVRAYRDFLEKVPHAPNAQEVRERINKLSAR
jgi:regulator of sirC expression with transglutaminase-like and TPR domain